MPPILETKGWGWGRSDKSYHLHGPLGFVGFPFPEARSSEYQPPIDSLDRIVLPPSRLTDNEIKPLRNIVGEDNVSTYSPDRAVHSLGKSYLDLICLRRGNILHPTDALVYPATETEIEKILKRARERHWIVIPFGGGTSVVGGIEPSADARPVIRVDLRRLSKILEVDTESWLATVQCRICGPVG